MHRRQFLRYGGASLLAGTNAFGLSSAASAACLPSGAPCYIRLFIDSVNVEMVDGKIFPMLGFRRVATSVGEVPDPFPRVPGPVLRVIENQQVTLQVRNYRPEPHSLHIPGAGPDGSVLRIDNIPARVGNSPGIGSVTFTAPVAGTYAYFDPSHPSRHLYRLLGLHGVMVVHPVNGGTTGASNSTVTPYSMDKLTAVDSVAAEAMNTVFNAFGSLPRFAGGKWVPSDLTKEYGNQERIWHFHDVDPDYNTLIKPTGIFRSATDPVIKRAVAVPTTADEILTNWTPRYFTINGVSGFDLSETDSAICKNYIGEPTLIRIVNTGLCHHSTHIHGNHLLELAHSYLGDDGLIPEEPDSRRTNIKLGEPIVHRNIWERDVWPTFPMQTRDMLLPYEVPPDIPDWSIFERGTNQEPFPMRFVMHDHTEMATTAAGGNYPQGAVMHWEILGPRRTPV